jgi:hypothetical protein
MEKATMEHQARRKVPNSHLMSVAIIRQDLEVADFLGWRHRTVTKDSITNMGLP